jgi:haloalkane dehalogenase
METLGEGWACFAPDLPGLGASGEPPPAFDYSREANNAFIDDVLAMLSIAEPVTLVVHDIGGIFGIPWAAANLDRVRGIVITNTVIFEHFPWFGLAKIWSQRGPLGRAFAAAVMWQIGLFGGRIFRKAYRRISPELSERDIDRVVEEFACNPVAKRSTLRLFRQMIPHTYFDGFDAMLSELIGRIPVRVVWGAPDPYIPPSFAQRFPTPIREVIEGAGHWVPISSAAQVARAVTAALSE